MNEHVERLAARISDEPLFLASALAAYARSEKADDQSLANTLGCQVDVLNSLRLCRIPRPEAPAFSQDVERIAERFSVDADELARVVRRGQVLMKTRSKPAGSIGTLMAARDKQPHRKKGGKGK